MQPGSDSAEQHAQRIADALEANWVQFDQQVVSTEHLIKFVEEIANQLSLLARDWEPLDPQRAQRCRTAEHEIRALGVRFSQLQEVEADEAKVMIGTLRRLTDLAQGRAGDPATPQYRGTTTDPNGITHHQSRSPIESSDDKVAARQLDQLRLLVARHGQANVHQALIDVLNAVRTVVSATVSAAREAT